MTVGDTISSPSVVPEHHAPPSIQMTQPTHPAMDQVNSAGVLQNSTTQAISHDTVPLTGSARGNTTTNSSVNPMATKVNQEILTSLHFIKDIRRLEKYQRDFFLKVKESLTHVHVLLDHQLMDMAWADNLADCEENLLKCSTCVQNSSSSQLVDAYNILLHDRERLNNRFQELSVKSSLSEFVVNSSQLLDIDAVRVAAETILKGENPVPAQGDNSVPVDHTFFLANFCTTSLASSMMASFVPKPVSISTPQGSNKPMLTGPIDDESVLMNTNFTQSAGVQPQQPSIYDSSRGIVSNDKKLNGNIVTSPALPANQHVQQIQGPVQGRPQNILSGNASQNGNGSAGNVAPANISNKVSDAVSPDTLSTSGVRGHPSGSLTNAASTGGIASNQTPTTHTASNGMDYVSGSSIPSAQDFNSSKLSTTQTESAAATNIPNIYDSAGGLDKFLLTAAAAKDGTAAERAAVVAAAEMAVSNGMYGQELVTAISQITNQTGTTNSRNVTIKSKSPQKPQLDPWGKLSSTTEDEGLAQQAANDSNSTNNSAESRGFTSRHSNVTNRSQNSKGNISAASTAASISSVSELNLPNDNASDSVSTVSDEGSRTGQTVTTPGVGDLNAKPLSFARIASLGLEKQTIHRPNMNNQQLAAVAAAQALGVGPAGSFAPNLTTLQMVNALAVDPQANPNVMATNASLSTALQQPPGLHMAHGSGNSFAASLQGNAAVGPVNNGVNGPPNAGHGSNSGTGNGNMSQAIHFNNPSQYPLQHQAQSNTATNQLHVGGGGIINHPGVGGSHLQQHASATAHNLMHSLPPTSNPRFYFDIVMEGKRLGRVIIEVQPSIAPKMSQNFSQLVTGERGFGYKGCHFFQAWRNESVICGDWEHNSGRGGRASIEGGPLFTPDDTRLPCIRGAVGMRRMSKKHSSLNQVASQFRIILANMNTQFTGIFGHVISGIDALDKVADMGGDGGRPEKTAMVSACGIFKS